MLTSLAAAGGCLAKDIAMSMRKFRSSLRSTVVGTLLVSALLSGAARAQNAAATDPMASEDDDIIMVTATRREGTVQSVPINIAAVGGAQIEREGLRSLSEAARAIPGINIVDQGPRGGSRIIVRGLSAEPLTNNDNSNDGGGTVATYLGETPIFLELKLNDIERVEVLLGPQGTLYGAGTLGGAIRYMPRRPQLGVTSLDVRANGYNYSAADGVSFDVGATINLWCWIIPGRRFLMR
jgi:iron complex outermembrane receptor protein